MESDGKKDYVRVRLGDNVATVIVLVMLVQPSKGKSWHEASQVAQLGLALHRLGSLHSIPYHLSTNYTMIMTLLSRAKFS